MAKINVKIREPKEEYDTSNQKQINRSITTLIEQLNSTFLDEVRSKRDSLGLSVANIYKNAKVDLTTTNNTTVYTAPSNSRAI